MRQFLYTACALLMLAGTASAAGGGAGGAGGAGGGGAGGGAGAGAGAAGGAGGGAAASADSKTVGDPNAYTPGTDSSGSAQTPNTARESQAAGTPGSTR